MGQISGQKPKLFSSFYRRAHQQYAGHLLRFQSLNRARNGQIGFAGTRRSYAEINVVFANGMAVALLVFTPGFDGLFGCANNNPGITTFLGLSTAIRVALYDYGHFMITAFGHQVVQTRLLQK